MKTPSTFPKWIFQKSVVTVLSAFMLSACSSSADTRDNPTDIESELPPSASLQSESPAPPSISSLKDVCEQAITATAAKFGRPDVSVDWTWPSDVITNSVRCYTDTDQSLTEKLEPKLDAHTTMWVEFRPYLHPDPGEMRYDACDLMEGLSRIESTRHIQVEGHDLCTVEDASPTGLRAESISTFIARRTVVVIGSLTYIPISDDFDFDTDDVANATRVANDDVHDALLPEVVKRFDQAA